PDGGKMVWSSPGAHAFVTALKGDMRTIGVAGHLSIVEKVKTRFEHQTVDAVQMIETGLVLRGRLGEARAPAAVEGAGAPRSIGYRLSITSVDPQQLELALELDDEEGVWAQLNWASSRAAAKFGFGVQFSRVNLSGKRVPLLTAEQGVGRGAQPLTLAAELLGGAGGQWWSTYAPAPFVLE